MFSQFKVRPSSVQEPLSMNLQQKHFISFHLDPDNPLIDLSTDYQSINQSHRTFTL